MVGHISTTGRSDANAWSCLCFLAAVGSAPANSHIQGLWLWIW